MAFFKFPWPGRKEQDEKPARRARAPQAESIEAMRRRARHRLIGATVLVLLMNKQKYESLPADLKAIVDKTSGLPLVERYGKAWDEASIAARNKVKSAPGHTVTVVSGAKYDAILKQAEVVEKEWLADAKAKGINGEALLAAARAAARKPSN